MGEREPIRTSEVARSRFEQLDLYFADFMRGFEPSNMDICDFDINDCQYVLFRLRKLRHELESENGLSKIIGYFRSQMMLSQLFSDSDDSIGRATQMINIVGTHLLLLRKGGRVLSSEGHN